MIARLTLSTSRLTLRKIAAEDAAGIARAGRDPAIRGMPWFGAGFQDAWAADWVRRALDEWDAGGHRNFTILGADGHYVGSVNLGRVADGQFEVAYWMLPEHRGQGIATEALQAALAWAEAAWPATRPWARTRLDNARSQRVLAKCGFRETHRARLAYFDRPSPPSFD